MREVSRRQAKLIKYHFFDGLSGSKSAALAGYKGKSTAALCNVSRRILLKFLENPQRFIEVIRREALREWHLQNLRTLRERLEREKKAEITDGKSTRLVAKERLAKDS
jgi:hypothetical protein